MKYKGYEIYLVNTLGIWYALIYKDGKKVYETFGSTGEREREQIVAEALIETGSSLLGIPTQQDRIKQNFEDARAIALTQGEQLMRRASAGEDEPFYGARFAGKSMVIWKPEDQQYADVIGLTKTFKLLTGLKGKTQFEYFGVYVR